MIIVFLVVLGLIFGSFVNALVWRLHEQAELRDKRQKLLAAKRGNAKALQALDTELRGLSMSKGRSMCSHCHHELAAKDLVPLFSWLWLRGKCRYCGVKIQDNPLVEVSTGILFALSYVWWPLSLQGADLAQFVIWLGLLVAFVALTVYDLRWYLLPDRIVYPVTVVAALQVVGLSIAKHDWHYGLNSLVGGLVIYGTFYLLFQLSAGKWIGGGDVKLSFALGLLAGSGYKSFLLLFISSIIGSLVSIPLLAKGKQGLQARVPYGPFLLLATYIVVLFGDHIIHWYKGLLL